MHIRTRTQRGVAALAAVLLAASLASCAPSADDGGGEVLTIGVVGNSKDQVQPYTQQGSSSASALYRQVYEGLTATDPSGAVIYKLAESMTPNETLDTWTVKLREGVTTHAGEEFVAEDAVESLKWMLDPDNAWAFATQIGFIDPEGLKIIDDYTFEMNLNRPYGPVPNALAMDRVLMRSLKGATEDAPAGTGPFEVASFTAGQEAQLTRFDDYWGEKAGVEKVKLSFFQDQQAVTNALRGGQVDIAHGIPFTDVPSLEKEPGINLLVSETASYPFMSMNMSVPPFDNPKVREAMRLIADREEIVEKAFGGYAVVGNDYIGKNTSCPTPDVPQRKQDLERAKQLLEEAGATDINVDLVTDAAFPGMMEMAQLYAQQAAKVGVTINVKKLDVASFLNRWLEWPFHVGYTSSPYLLTATSHFLPGGSENSTHMDDAEYNALADKLYMTADPDEQCGFVSQMQAIENKRGGDIVVVNGNSIAGYRDGVTGLKEELYGKSAYALEGVTLKK
ncbi:ABC transporter substrate-binding protein [Leucobacter insecticola]|uniref:ABC transporter substrate-binding protein n=1 Tax=Leucobacter insecticola TaxID=2714934 RepID=A0A6G8FIR0_9MICO|nr:ABC transporter substrate-binding protein [Leucobacter insecticola]QIM16255.1 ABC transporter substrate-binding protein [Leucobacter insecticola]